MKNQKLYVFYFNLKWKAGKTKLNTYMKYEMVILIFRICMNRDFDEKGIGLVFPMEVGLGMVSYSN